MKNTLFILIFFVAIFGLASKSENDKSKASGTLKTSKTEGPEYRLTGSENVINWIGSKPGGQHHGTVDITEGKITYSGNQIKDGNFKFDLNTIKDLDLENPGMNAKLVGHLKSSDFFNTEKFPFASFEIVSVKSTMLTNAGKESEVKTNSEVTGNLTIKGVTKSIIFPARIILEKNIVSVITNPFSINRTSWG